MKTRKECPHYSKNCDKRSFCGVLDGFTVEDVLGNKLCPYVEKKLKERIREFNEKKKLN